MASKGGKQNFAADANIYVDFRKADIRMTWILIVVSGKSISVCWLIDVHGRTEQPKTS